MKLLILIAPIFYFASGTAAPRSESMAYDDLDQFKVDCKHPYDQLDFLKLQLQNSIIPDQRAIISHAMNEISTWCATPKATVQGCVHVREDFVNGTGQSTVCKQYGKEREVVNRWEAVVDH